MTLHRFLVATLLSLLLSAGISSSGQPSLSSWYTDQAGRYARLFQTTADEASANAVTTWSGGEGVQDLPTYAGVHEIATDETYVYVRSTGLGFHTMGPWYLDEAKTQLFPNYPANQAVTFRFPLEPGDPIPDKTETGLGAIGYFVDGIAMFDSRDAFSYSTSGGTDATPINGIQGDGVWNRDAFVNESVTFDAANAHQAGSNHHYHANPPALRYLLCDSVSYDSGTNRYSEQVGGSGSHSPIIAWVSDGLPVYGPYGYSDPLDPGSPVRKMVTGYQKRDGSNGSTDLSSTGRTTLPQWVVRNDDAISSTTLSSNRYGPNVNAIYVLGRYLEDYAYKGDLTGLSQYDGTGDFNPALHFDLNEYNVRFCVTPEFPEGTWAYFTCIEDDGTPTFPYNIGRYFFAPVLGGTTDSIPIDATVVYRGGPDAEPRILDSTLGSEQATISLVWSGAEGGSYVIKESTDLIDWIQISNPVAVDEYGQAASTEAIASSDFEEVFHRVSLSSVAPFDDEGFQVDGGGSGGTGSTTFAVSFPTTPPLPPSDVATITVGGVAATVVSYDQDSGAVVIELDTALLDSGDYYPVLSFTPPNSAEMEVASTTLITIESGPTASNVLLLIVDDWGIDASPFDNATPGVALPNLPNLETLAARGIQFTNAYAQPLCSPTRASMLTGRLPFRNGVGNPTTDNTLASSETALPELMASEGAPHGLASFGKWHLGGGRSGPADRGGWQKFAGILQGGVSDYANWDKVEDGTLTSGVTTYSTTDQVNEAIEYIDGQSGDPWFVWMAFNAPHTPFHDPAPYVTPESGYSTNGSTNQDHYIKMLEALDSEIGRLLAAVDLEKTNIILIGDNGTPNQVVQAPFGDGHSKGDLYEGGIHVPMLAAGPDVTATAGSQDDTFVHCVDLFATILELAGIDVASATAGIEIDSTSLVPLFRGESLPSRYVVSEKFGDTDGNGRSIRSEAYPNHKLIIFGDKDSSADAPTFELFHLDSDPNELAPINLDSLSGADLEAYQHLLAIDAELGGGYSDPQA